MVDGAPTNRTYRADINGLRAVAVILVLLFHLEYDLVPAGFLGVDIFLVISGYLISRNILEDLKFQRFSFVTFYTRRFKRLFPALFVTLVLSLVVGYLTLTPFNLERLSKTVVAGVFFYSNFFFLNETGYFDTESAYKPLLHIWSLSLEEQFYFIWPLLLLMIFLLARRIVFLFVLIIALLSIYAAESYNRSYPEGAFYLLQFRFFEFLLGALCIWLERFKLRNKILRELTILTGLIMICYSATMFTALTPMPGALSLIPCVGAMLIIYGGNANYSGWLLRNRLVEIIGKSSYSIYLVHWPLIVYYKYYTLSDLDHTSRTILGIISILLGLLMWKYVENTFRKSELKLGKIDASWIWMPVLMLSLFYVSRLVIANKGYPSRYSAEFVMTEKEIFASRNKYWEGSNSEKEVLKGTNNKKVLVVGNSFAIDLIYALRKNGMEAKITALQTTHRCYNFGAAAVNEQDARFCAEIVNGVLQDTSWSKAEAIYLFDHWPKVDLENLKDMLTRIRGLSKAPIYVFGPKMVFTKPIPDIVHACKSASTYAINKFAQDFAEKKDRNELNQTLIKFFEDESWRKNKIFYIDVLNVLEEGENQFDIISRQTSDFLYFDPSHFTDQGAKEFGEKLKASYPEIFEVVQ
jgi:peptidoglycan/LPS O-acetylase OafA/YrhL